MSNLSGFKFDAADHPKSVHEIFKKGVTGSNSKKSEIDPIQTCV